MVDTASLHFFDPETGLGIYDVGEQRSEKRTVRTAPPTAPSHLHVPSQLNDGARNNEEMKESERVPDLGGESPVVDSIDWALIGRRAFLSGSLLSLLGLAVGRVRVAAAAQPVGSQAGLAAFLRLSRLASGASDLPVNHARAYFTALDADGVLKLKPSSFARLAGVTGTAGPSTLAELERSPAFRAPGGKECLEAIASAWWSGIVPVAGGGQRVVTFSDALVWREVHEPTTCQGATGSWAKPGRAVE